MDSSQGPESDIFTSDNSDPDELNIKHNMGTCYKSLVFNTKETFQHKVNSEINKTSFPTFFSTLLEDCRLCISQSLDQTTNILSNPDVSMDKLIKYINDSAEFVQMLSDSIKTIIESVSLTCYDMKTFPTLTANIIKIVFSHCNNSDSIYGTYLNKVSNHLSELFRSCRELQLTYLMVLETHFVFDLNDNEQLDTLIEVLKINLNIGEVVAALDLKSTGEQWKTIISICEKYYYGIKDISIIYNNCTKVICNIIEKNIKIASEPAQEENLVVRSVKMSKFMLRKLLKIIDMFKHSTPTQQEDILDIIIYLYSNCFSFSDSEKSIQFINLMHTHIICEIEMLQTELILDQTFVDCLVNYDKHKIRKDDKLLGYILLLLAIVKIVIQCNNDKHVVHKQAIIHSVYGVLPYCHIWFNMNVKFKMEGADNYKTEGLYERLLTYMTALAVKLNSDEYQVLEKCMVKSLVNTDCLSALFSSNLWTLLARLNNGRLLVNQLTFLCKIYKNYETDKLFEFSPQKVYLGSTISNLFEFLETGDKIKLYNEVINCGKNQSLLRLLEIKKLPNPIGFHTLTVSHKLRQQFAKLETSSIDIEEINCLKNYMSLVTSCSITEDNGLVEMLIKAWDKMCFANSSNLIQGDQDRQTLWFFQYTRALVSLTDSRRHEFCERSVNIVKALHAILSLVETGNIGLQLVLIDLIFNLVAHEECGEISINIYNLFMKIFKHLYQNTNSIVRYKLVCCIKSHNKVVNKIILNTTDGDKNKVKEIYDFIIKQGFKEIRKCKDKLLNVMDNEYSHKCIQNRNVIEVRGESDLNVKNVCKQSTGNFNLIVDDINELYERENEPACKKIKLNHEVDDIITKLKNEVSKLCQVKENFTVKQKNEIRDMCDKMKDLI